MLQLITSIAPLILLAPFTTAICSGSGSITTHDYLSMPPSAYVNSAPSCGTNYTNLDITRITAVQLLDKTVDCGTCIRVSSGSDPTRYVDVLAVDTGGRGLDLSTPSFQHIFDDTTGVYPAQWQPVSSDNCRDIYKGTLPETTLPAYAPTGNGGNASTNNIPDADNANYDDADNYDDSNDTDSDSNDNSGDDVKIDGMSLVKRSQTVFSAKFRAE